MMWPCTCRDNTGKGFIPGIKYILPDAPCGGFSVHFFSGESYATEDLAFTRAQDAIKGIASDLHDMIVNL